MDTDCCPCSEFVLNHLHSSHKHRRFNGDSLDMTMVVPQVEVETNSNTIRYQETAETVITQICC